MVSINYRGSKYMSFSICPAPFESPTQQKKKKSSQITCIIQNTTDTKQLPELYKKHQTLCPKQENLQKYIQAYQLLALPELASLCSIGSDFIAYPS